MRHAAALPVLLAILLLLLQPAKALYFYLDGSDQKCFIEELPLETTVIGTFKAEQYSEPSQRWEDSKDGVQIFVEVHGRRVINNKASAKGKFTFTTSEAGDHAICFTTAGNGWFAHSKTKVFLDLMFGDAEHDMTETKKEVLSGTAQVVRDLNSRVHAIRREQQYQREREAEFRDTSERTNSRVVWWTFAQIGVLITTCLWQIRHLKSFFITKKLV
ncbi:emp24p/erv25p- protein [Rhizophlyctis rosea]|uniref:Emp24p/erv25p- protein n=1 Tax=Rhizophlyctis rosea TaxID=64517 RepID=A0AAD5SKP3_9FUNG|nr:emp24p/erv25p- protein [Rhizophlyctis rosea]